VAVTFIALLAAEGLAEGNAGNVRSATFRAASNALDVADAIAVEAKEGSAAPMSSIGFPAILVSLPAKLGCSRDLTARRRASRSSSLIWVSSTRDKFGLRKHRRKNKSGSVRFRNGPA
jgi:hypothetical protein